MLLYDGAVYLMNNQNTISKININIGEQVAYGVNLDSSQINETVL